MTVYIVAGELCSPYSVAPPSKPCSGTLVITDRSVSLFPFAAFILCAIPPPCFGGQPVCRLAVMTTSLIIHGQLHSPAFIFVRRPHEFADADLLTRFGLHNYERTESVPQFERYAILADAGTWTLLADDWHYTIWHMPTTGPTIEDLASTHDVFACSVGDIDRSFDFVYYRNAALVREYVVSDPFCRGRKVIQNYWRTTSGRI